MSKAVHVAWREFKATALTRAFILAAVIVPVLMIGLAILGPVLFNPTPPPLKGTIAIIDPSGELAKAAAIEFAPENIAKHIRGLAKARQEAPSGLTERNPASGDFDRNPRSMTALTHQFEIDLNLDDQHTPVELDTLKAQLARGELIGILTTHESDAPATSPDQTDGQEESPFATLRETGSQERPELTRTRLPDTRLYVRSNMNVKHTGLIEDLVQSATGRAKIQGAGLDVQQVRDLARAPQPLTVRISRDGREKAENQGAKIAKMFTPMAFMMLIWMGAFVSANYLLTTTIEEKSNKVIEVLLSAVSPMQLMAGKIVGQALVGLVLVAMYMGMAAVALTAMAYADLIEWHSIVYFAIYYVMAYFMIASIMAAIGSAVNELREAQSLITPAMLVMMIPLMLWLPISDSPNGALATVTSFIPPLIPFVMILRVTGGEAIPFWQIPATIVIGYAAMLGMIWMASKIFRVGVLMYGKPPTPIELLKWVRYT
jgi:ABC-2 type transport system permease protein